MASPHSSVFSCPDSVLLQSVPFLLSFEEASLTKTIKNNLNKGHIITRGISNNQKVNIINKQ